MADSGKVISMIKMKRIFAAASAVVMAAGVFASCGNTDSSSKAENVGSSHVTEKGEMRDISSMDLVKEMNLCWNLGNSLDVCNADRDGDGQVDENSEKVDETLWGNVKTTPEIFDQLKKDGFNAVRIPITWRDHLSDDYTIDEDWMNRVEEVVDYAYDRDFYVIINVHHDGGGDPDFGAWIRTEAEADYENFSKKYNKIWTQIAKRFENYSDKLIFESMNEVGFDDMGTNQAYELLNKINQDFVDLIRKQGGNNPKRHLLIAGYWTDVEKTCSKLFKMPDDPENRCIVSVAFAFVCGSKAGEDLADAVAGEVHLLNSEGGNDLLLHGLDPVKLGAVLRHQKHLGGGKAHLRNAAQIDDVLPGEILERQ